MLRKAIRVLYFQLKQIRSSLKIQLIFILIAIFIYATVEPVNDFASSVNVLIRPWVFPHLTNDFICQLVIMSGTVLLFCDAPFKGDAHNYILPYTGHKAWAMGMCLYIVVISFIYVLLILVAGTIALLPNIQLGNGWGKIWGTLARTNAGSQFGLSFKADDYILGKFAPLQATILCFLLEWACCTWLGMITYLFNYLTGTMIGSLLAAGFVFLDITIANEWSYIFYRISPVTMSQIHTLSGSTSLYGLTVKYAVSFFIISIVTMSILCIYMMKIKKIIKHIVHRLRKVQQYD